MIALGLARLVGLVLLPLLASTKWAAGPALIVGVQPGNWSIFGLRDNVWSFAGSDDEDINLLNFQYQAVYLFPKDWFFITNWTVEADWEAPGESNQINVSEQEKDSEKQTGRTDTLGLMFSADRSQRLCGRLRR